MEKSLSKFMEAPCKAFHKENHNKKVKTIEVTESVDMMVCIRSPPVTTKGPLTALQEEMVMVEVPMALPAVTNNTLVTQLMDVIVIMVPLVVVMVALWMTNTVEAQKSSSSSEQECEGAIMIGTYSTLGITVLLLYMDSMFPAC